MSKKKKFWGRNKEVKEESAPDNKKEYVEALAEAASQAKEFEVPIREWLEKHFDLFIDFKTEQTKQSRTGFTMAIEKVVGRFVAKAHFDTYCEKLPDGMEAKLVVAQNEFFSIPNIAGKPVRDIAERVCTEIVKTRQKDTKHELKEEAKKKDTVVISLDPKIREKLGIEDK